MGMQQGLHCMRPASPQRLAEAPAIVPCRSLAGCQPVEWQQRGSAFPHLMHHPGFIKTETYGSKREWLQRAMSPRG